MMSRSYSIYYVIHQKVRKQGFEDTDNFFTQVKTNDSSKRYIVDKSLIPLLAHYVVIIIIYLQKLGIKLVSLPRFVSLYWRQKSYPQDLDSLLFGVQVDSYGTAKMQLET